MVKKFILIESQMFNTDAIIHVSLVSKENSYIVSCAENIKVEMKFKSLRDATGSRIQLLGLLGLDIERDNTFYIPSTSPNQSERE